MLHRSTADNGRWRKGGGEGEEEEESEGEGEREGESKEGKESRKERELYMFNSRAAALTRERHSERNGVEDDKACRPRALCTYVDVHCH